jgi:cell division protein FtsZ
LSQENLRQFANIKVLGVGGGGGNAVNRMVAASVQGVEFWSINTDIQALNVSLADQKLQIGTKLTKGLGGGAIPSIGEQSAKESQEDLDTALEGADMVFITCGMGGGTGTGASPIIARAAKDHGALTIAVVTKPFRFEGPVRNRQAEEGIEKLREHVDAMIIIPNEKLLEVVERMTSMVDAFKIADDILRQGVQGIADLITIPGLINLDFADVKTIMKDSGSAMMGIGRASGENRAVEAAKEAVASPLLEETIDGATGVILNITGSDSLSLHEVHEAADVIYGCVDPNANILFGSVINENLKDEIIVTVIATGFNGSQNYNEFDTSFSITQNVQKEQASTETSYSAPVTPARAYENPANETPAYITPETQGKYRDTNASTNTNQGTPISTPSVGSYAPQQSRERQPEQSKPLITPTSDSTNGQATGQQGTAAGSGSNDIDEFDLDVPAFLRNIN